MHDAVHCFGSMAPLPPSQPHIHLTSFTLWGAPPLLVNLMSTWHHSRYEHSNVFCWSSAPVCYCEYNQKAETGRLGNEASNSPFLFPPPPPPPSSSSFLLRATSLSLCWLERLMTFCSWSSRPFVMTLSLAIPSSTLWQCSVLQTLPAKTWPNSWERM